jgi:hypothetical protein
MAAAALSSARLGSGADRPGYDPVTLNPSRSRSGHSGLHGSDSEAAGFAQAGTARPSESASALASDSESQAVRRRPRRTSPGRTDFKLPTPAADSDDWPGAFKA